MRVSISGASACLGGASDQLRQMLHRSVRLGTSRRARHSKSSPPFNSEEARGAKKLTTGLAPLKGPFIAVGPGSSDRQVSKDAAGNSLSTADGRHKPVDGC